MESVFDKYLRDLINLTPIKIVPGKKKKVISSSIFIPEEPNITDKTFSYFTGLIKSIEVFSDRMPKDWIYRLYIDELFVSGFKFKADKTIEKSIYNSISSNSNTGGVYKTITKRKIIKKKIRGEKDNLKKLQYLLFLFIQKIIKSKDVKYKNIELISFRCDMASETNKYPGHSSTFGSIVRLFPLFDSDVDLFISVNCRYPMNKLLKEIILEFDKNKEKKLLTFRYETSFIKSVTHGVLFTPFYKIKSQETDLKPEQSLFVECINQMLDVKHSIIGKDLGLNFNKLKIYRLSQRMYGLDPIITHQDRKGRIGRMDDYFEDSIAAGLFGMKRDRMFTQRIEAFANFFKYLIVSKSNFRFGVDEILLKYILAPEVITMYLGYERDDILSLKYMGKKKKPINYIFNLYPPNSSNIKLNHLFERDTTFLLDEQNKILILRTYLGEIVEESKNYYQKETLPDFVFELTRGEHVNYELQDLQFFEARSLFVNHKVKELKEKDKVKRVIYKIGSASFESLDFNILYLFSTFDEFKKIFVFDSKSTDRDMGDPTPLNVLNNFTEIDKYYVFKDIQDYKLENIGVLLGELIEHFKDLREPELHEVIIERELLESSNNSATGAGGKTKRKGKKTKKTKKKI